MAAVDELWVLTANAKRIAASTGAGILTEAGIPDVRSPGAAGPNTNRTRFNVTTCSRVT